MIDVAMAVDDTGKKYAVVGKDRAITTRNAIVHVQKTTDHRRVT